ncbi:MAG: tRNA pseudouridine(55) synthase TruB [bacterium]
MRREFSEVPTPYDLTTLQAGKVIPVDKPRQWTSFQVVGKLKAALPKKPAKIKIGHAGTLDPLATGLLLVCVGKATKSIPQLQESDKVYTGTLVLGATTPSFDLEHPVDRRYPYEHITHQLVEEKAQHLTGTLLQTPPLYSAVKIDGRRAYLYARGEVEGAHLALPAPKEVTVYSFEITAFRAGERGDGEMRGISENSLLTSHLYKSPLGSVPPQLPQADFRICCGKGTYIRSLARDLGQALGSGAFLAALRRERIGHYTLDGALTPDQAAEYIRQAACS